MFGTFAEQHRMSCPPITKPHQQASCGEHLVRKWRSESQTAAFSRKTASRNAPTNLTQIIGAHGQTTLAAYIAFGAWDLFGSSSEYCSIEAHAVAKWGADWGEHRSRRHGAPKRIWPGCARLACPPKSLDAWKPPGSGGRRVTSSGQHYYLFV